MKTIIALLTSLLVCTAAAEPAHDAAKDPFVAAALGAIPLVSGLYLSDKPARGVLFTAVDVLVVMGIYTARNTASGNPENVKAYFLVMGANNLLDACLSAYYARNPLAPRVLLLPTEGEGLATALHWTF